MITLYFVGEGDRRCWRDMNCFCAALQLLSDVIRYEISSFKVLRAWLRIKVIKELRMPSKGEFGEIDRVKLERHTGWRTYAAEVG